MRRVGVGLVQPGLLLARAVVVRGLAQLVVLEAGAGEERVFACRRVRVVMVELVVDEVEDEERVDDPDAGGEVGSAVVHEREAPGPRAVADLAGDAQFQRPCPGARGQRVELGLELVGVAAEQPGGPRAGVVAGELGAGAFELVGGVQ